MDILTWEEHLYSSVFDSTYDALLDQYREGKLTLEELQTNIEEQQLIMLNCSTEGAARFQHCSAMVDAHQFALSTIKNEML